MAVANERVLADGTAHRATRQVSAAGARDTPMSLPFVGGTLPGRVPVMREREIPHGQSSRWRFGVAR